MGAIRTDREFIGEEGYSLAEMIVVMVLIAVVTSIAIIQFSAPKRQFSRQNVSRELKVALERARFDSVRRRADSAASRARVVINTGAFTLGTDKDNDGTVESGENETKTFSGQNIVIAGSGMAFPVTLVYDQRGEVIATDAGSNVVTPVFRVCNASCSSPSNANSDLLVVTPTGTVNLLSGSSSVPTFASPSITTIGGATDIDPLVTVP